jgi:hypothetical protein
MLLWKVFALVSAAVSLGYWWALFRGTEPFDSWAKVGVAIQVLGLVGLFTYAFTILNPNQPFWMVFQAIFAASCLLGLWRDLAKFRPEPGVLIGAAIYTPLVVFEWLALYRLGGSPLGNILIL